MLLEGFESFSASEKVREENAVYIQICKIVSSPIFHSTQWKSPVKIQNRPVSCW